MIDTINRNMLRHHVAHTMFCPHCAHVLDVRTAVSVDLMRNGDIVRTHALCAPCYERIRELLQAIAARTGCTVEVLDGRVLFARRTARKSA